MPPSRTEINSETRAGYNQFRCLEFAAVLGVYRRKPRGATALATGAQKAKAACNVTEKALVPLFTQWMVPAVFVVPAGKFSQPIMASVLFSAT